MARRRIPPHIIAQIMRRVDAQQTTLAAIARTNVCSLRTLYRIRHDWVSNGYALTPNAPVETRGRPRKMSQRACGLLTSLYRRDSALTLAELRMELARRDAGVYSLSCISRQLKHMGLGRKKMSVYAKQRSREERLEFACRIGQYPPEYLVFTDESGVDSGSTQRTYGRAMVGHRAYKSYHLVKGKRYNVIPACALGSGPFATYIHEGQFCGDDFYLYLRDYVLPACNSFPGPRSVIVCDNAAVHKLSCIIDLVESAGELLWGPDGSLLRRVLANVRPEEG